MQSDGSLLRCLPGFIFLFCCLFVFVGAVPGDRPPDRTGKVDERRHKESLVLQSGTAAMVVTLPCSYHGNPAHLQPTFTLPLKFFVSTGDLGGKRNMKYVPSHPHC